jgi:hypothetical protein
MYINPALPENIYKTNDLSCNNENFVLTEDVLYKINSCNNVKLFNKVAAIFNDKNTLYYVRNSEDKWIAGFLNVNSGTGKEFEISGRYEKLYKFIGFNEVFYFLVHPVKENGSESSATDRVLIRFNPDNNSYQKIDGIVDFILLNGKPLLLKKGILDYNGSIIPLLLTGNMKISFVKDSRIVFISDENGTEVADLLSGKSFYQYRENSIPEYSDDCNLIIEFTDRVSKNQTSPSDENTVYYEVLVDGVDENRTETGRGDICKTFHSKLDTGKYHIIKPERWELDKTKGRYVRVNNILQPGELKILIPDKRIIKIKIEFDGSGYIVNQAVLFKE